MKETAAVFCVGGAVEVGRSDGLDQNRGRNHGEFRDCGHTL